MGDFQTIRTIVLKRLNLRETEKLSNILVSEALNKQGFVEVIPLKATKETIFIFVA